MLYFLSDTAVGETMFDAILKRDGLTAYPQKVLAAKRIASGIVSLTEHTFAAHHYAGSWAEKIEEIKARREKGWMLYQKFAGSGQ